MGEREIWFREDVSEQEWESHAVECEQEVRKIEQDKFRIQDEDGFPIYHDQMMKDKKSEARLARNHGVDFVFGLVNLQGELVNARMVDGRYGKVWCVEKSDGSVEWVNVSVARSVAREQEFYRGKGYQIAKVFYRFGSGRNGFWAMKERGVVRIEIQS
jgi:hypothetical protein